ncbi:hypothetical protein COH32_12125 [Neisseria meningitidis]|nr:hypothetical protein COI07_12045 [Neisseria meningitidis]RQL19850.1 hypothetical protein COH31_12220 [Neisseria meningitidis]RQL26930.1 hypothetical protein COH32_12125 [Neisseria meningitidis]RQL33737.1 hypothetical protein COH28_12055 [Neisseria meningitidis]
MPAKAGIQSVQFRSFPINACCFSFLDSHFRGNDGCRCPMVFNSGLTKIRTRRRSRRQYK